MFISNVADFFPVNPAIHRHPTLNLFVIPKKRLCLGFPSIWIAVAIHQGIAHTIGHALHTSLLGGWFSFFLFYVGTKGLDSCAQL